MNFDSYDRLRNLVMSHFRNITDDIPTAASLQSAKWFPNQKGWNTQRDAARHALWNAAMTSQYGELPTAAMTTLWEIPELLGGDTEGVKMDLYNNATGRRIAKEMGNWKDIMNVIRTEAELAGPKPIGLLDRGDGLIVNPSSY